MPSWKKVITSGSNASLNSLYAPSITGSLLGTASYAIYAETASVSLATTENRIIVMNKSGATITKGMVVHLTGSNNSSDTPYVITASYESDSLSANTLGIAYQTITTNNTGYVVTEGVLTGIDVTGFISGQILYLGATGSIIGTAPVAPLHSVRLGQVVRDSPSNNGSIYVRIDNGYEIGELHDVRDTTTSTSYGDLLIKSASIWTNSKQLSGSYGITGSLSATSFTGSLFGTSSWASNAVSASFATSASWAPGGGASFPYTGSAEITGSLGVTGSFSVLDSIDATNKILIGSGPIPGSTEASVNWDSRTLLDSNGNFSVRWGVLRTMFDASQVDSINWDVRRLISTNTSRSIDWENRFLHDSSGNITVDWTSTALYDVSAKNALNWDVRDAYDSAEILAINWDARRLFDSSAVAAVRWDLRSAYDTVDSQSIDWGSRLLKIDNGPGAYTVNWNAGILRDTNSKNSVDWQNRQLKNNNGDEILNWQSGVKITGSAIVSGSFESTGSFKVYGAGTGFAGPFAAIEIDDANFSRRLYDYSAGSASIDFGNRNLLTANGAPAISWDGTAGTYSTNLYNSQTINLLTRDNLYGYNQQGGQILAESYFDIAVMDNDLVSLGNDGQWYQVDQTTDSSTRMLGIAKNVFSQTGSVFIEGDIVVTSGAGYPLIANPGYGAPIYIKQSAGTAMDTTTPTSGYVRLLGYCYASYNGGTDWIMKFRPSNDWYVI